MDFKTALMEGKKVVINLVIDDLEVLFRIELNTVFHYTLIHEKTNTRLYSYAYALDPKQSMMWNLEDCIKKTDEQLGKLVYSKKTGEFSVPNDIQDLAYQTFQKYMKKKEDCCICLEKAVHKTTCGHVCCHKCLAKVNSCPICRKKL